MGLHGNSFGGVGFLTYMKSVTGFSEISNPIFFMMNPTKENQPTNQLMITTNWSVLMMMV